MRVPKVSVLIISFFVGCIVGVYLGKNLDFSFGPVIQVTTPSPTTTPSRVNKVIEQLTPQQKITQLLAVPMTLESAKIADDATFSAQIATAEMLQLQPGFVVLFGTAVSMETTQLATQLIHNANTTLPIVVAVDHEGGRVQRLRGTGYTILPSWQELCDQDIEKMTSTLEISAIELKRAGIDMVLGPMLDVSEESNPALGTRICAETVEEVELRAVELINVFLTQGITPVIKHYPGIGSVQVDLHFDRAEVNATDEEKSLYLRILQKYPQVGVMVGHVGIIGGEPGVPCSLSESCVGQLAREFPRSLIMTDSLEMVSAGYLAGNESESLPLTLRSQKAILAGNNVLIFGPETSAEHFKEVVKDLTHQYETDPVFALVVESAVERVVEWKIFNDYLPNVIP